MVIIGYSREKNNEVRQNARYIISQKGDLSIFWKNHSFFARDMVSFVQKGVQDYERGTDKFIKK